MRRRAVLCIFAIAIPAVCLAQSNQTETISISTYYPSPSGVYKTIRLFPSNEPTTPEASQPGTMFFNQSDNTTYFFNGNAWEILGASGSGGSGGASGSGPIVDSGHKVWPNDCPGTLAHILVGSDDYVLCSVPWSKKISFSKTFTSRPKVFVSAETLSGSSDGNDPENYTCGEHATDLVSAYPVNITDNDFELRIGSSATSGNHCYHVTGDWRVLEYYGKGEAGWVAIGD